MSISIRFEMLTLMQTLHAVRLMPTDTYEEERARLVELLTRERWSVSPLKLDDWIDAAGSPWPQFSLPDSLFEEREQADVEEGTFDWRAIISDLLKAAYPVADADEIREEICHLGVQSTGEERLSTAVLRRSMWLAQAAASDQQNKMWEEIHALRRDLSELRQEIARVGISSAAPNTSSPMTAARDSNPNRDRIEALQREIASCHWAAGDAEARGDRTGAAYWRGQAEKTESKLRALGA